jgi:maltooligosyltrehalose trehalohydrolase
LALHRDLLRLRRDDPVLSNTGKYRLDGATLTERAFVLRWFTDDDTDRLLIVNLDREVRFDSIPEPMIAPPRDKQWALAWCSEDTRYGGHGVITPMENGGRGRWYLTAQSAALLKAEVRVEVDGQRTTSL